MNDNYLITHHIKLTHINYKCLTIINDILYRASSNLYGVD